MFPNASLIKDAANNIKIIPLMATLTVAWEDCCHGMLLLLLRKWIGTQKWWTFPIHGIATLILMTEFGFGHLYQGLFAALLLSLYVPYSIRLGKQYGWGTVMICHTLFDFSTILTMKLLVG
jgi:hypothetical protein